MSPMKYNLYFHCSENTAFYIFTAVKYSFLKICIIFNKYFSVFHYFVYNKALYYSISFFVTWCQVSASGPKVPLYFADQAAGKYKVLYFLGPSIHGLVTDIQVNVYTENTSIVKAALSNWTNIEDSIIISPLFHCISLIFLQKAMVQYTIFKTVLLYLFNVYPFL